MTKKGIYTFLLLCVLNWSCSDDNNNPTSLQQVNITSVITLGGSNNDSAQSVVSTQDGGYAILGHTQSNDGDVTGKTDTSFDYWLLKYNAEDQLEWQNTYGGSGDDRGRSIIQTQDNGYAILGSSTSSDNDVSVNNGLQDYWLAKLDATGAISWQKSFGFQGDDIGISVIQTNDMGYLVSGILDVTASGGAGNINRHAGGDYWVVKLDTNGNTEWARYFGGNFTDTPEGVVQTTDNGFIIAGGSDSSDTDITNNIGNYDFWVIKISADGNLLWEKNFGGTFVDEAKAMVVTSDGNYIIAGDTNSDDFNVTNNIGATDVWLIKINGDGNIIWERTYGGISFDVARAINVTQDQGFLVTGSSRSSSNNVSQNQGQTDIWAFKINQNGDLLWTTSIGGSNIDFGYGIAELNDNSVVVVGDTSSSDGDFNENKGFTDAVIIKIQ